MPISTLRIAMFAATLLAAASIGIAAESVKSIKPTANVIELFAAMESGEIEVKVFPKDDKGGNITIKNNTDKPLTIKVPEAFAGVPVLAQGFGGCPGGGGLGGCPGGGGGGGNQGFGGGMGGMGMGGMGGGFFNVAPDKVAKAKFAAVCLDHGKEDPNPRIEYKLIPIDEYAKDPAVTEVIKLMLAGKLDQHSAQAAAWHLQNGLTWEELAKKIGAKHLDGSVEAYFSPVNLQRALAATRIAKERAEKIAESKTVAKSAGTEE